MAVWGRTGGTGEKEGRKKETKTVFMGSNARKKKNVRKVCCVVRDELIQEEECGISRNLS